MSERPILFSAPMIRALLAGTKMQTRRLITRANSYRDGSRASAQRWSELDWTWPHIFVDGGPSPAGNPGPYLHVQDKDGDCSHRIYPQWQPGDRLYVKEQHAFDEASGGLLICRYPADGEARIVTPPLGFRPVEKRGRPSIHMPRWASRITLAITDVRVERLATISPEDCLAEGIPPNPNGSSSADGLRAQFAQLWNGINSLDDQRFAWNPWVWVLCFRRLP